MRRLLLLCILSLTAIMSPALARADDAPWYGTDAAGAQQVHLYFFWSEQCPHCLIARPYVEALPGRHPWLVLHSQEVSHSRANAVRYGAMAQSLGQEASSVPAFLFCGRMKVGFNDAQTTGMQLEEALSACHNERKAGSPVTVPVATGAASAIDLPLLGKIDPQQLSLPTFTLIIAGLDAFNPCAFFVLLFLLSLLVHARSRLRMLFIGGVFVFFSGLIYFLFMAAWLNAFKLMGEIRLVTLFAGGLAVLVALLNIKDYFWFKQGVSLSIPDSAKPGLYQRVRGLLRADSLVAMTVGTVALAIVANTYELLCTTGFPMIYTRVLTLSGLSTASHYLYLVFYNVVYVIPLLAIVLVFSFSLGTRKLSEAEGRFLKLISGLMMLGLGILLMTAPALLSDLRAVVTLPLATVALAWLFHRWHERTK